MTGFAVSLYQLGGRSPQHRGSLATRSASQRDAIDAVVQYAYGRHAAFDHYNALTRGDTVYGHVSRNPHLPTEFPVRLDITPRNKE